MMLLCARCLDEADKLFPTNCGERPETRIGQAIGMYHCPDCGAMLLAGVPHGDICFLCIKRKHPAWDMQKGE